MTLFAAAVVLAITNVSIIDGPSVRAGQTVLIRNGRIEQVGKIAPPRDAEILNGTGKFLIPGLWDMHTHVLTDPAKYFPALLAAGVTGIRNMHQEAADSLASVQQVKRDAESGKIPGLRIVANGPILDGPKPFHQSAIAIGDKNSAKLAAQQMKAGGADFLKVYDFLPRDAYFALAAEAQHLHIPVVGHVPVWVTPEEASRAGQKSIEHLSGIFVSCAADGRLDDEMKMAAARWPIDPRAAASRMYAVHTHASTLYDSSICAPLFRVFVEKGTWQCPTLVVLRNVQQPGLKVVQEMHKAGVRLLAGTDAGNPGMEPGISLQNELALMVKAGLTPAEALATATRNPAEFLGRLKDFGSVEQGKFADLVLLDGNPLEDIANIKRVASVVLRGRVVPLHP